MLTIDLSSDDETPTLVQKSSTEKQQNLKLGQHCQPSSPKKKKTKVDSAYKKKLIVGDNNDFINHVIMIWLHRVQNGYKNIEIPDEILEEKAKEAACILDLLDKFSPNRWIKGFKFKLKRMQEDGRSMYFNHSSTIRIKEIIDEERPFFSRFFGDGNSQVKMIQEKQEIQLSEIEEVHQKQLAQMVKEQKEHYEKVKESQRKQMEEIKKAQEQRYAQLRKQEETKLAELKRVPGVVKATSYAPSRAVTPICIPSTIRATVKTCTPPPTRTTAANFVPSRALSPALVRTIGSVTIRPLSPAPVPVPATALAPAAGSALAPAPANAFAPGPATTLARAPLNAPAPVRAFAPVRSLTPRTLAPTSLPVHAPAPALAPLPALAPAPLPVRTPVPTFSPGPATAPAPDQKHAPAFPAFYETIDLDDVLDDPIQSYEEALDCLTLVENYFLSVRNLQAVLLVSKIEGFLRRLIDS